MYNYEQRLYEVLEKWEHDIRLDVNPFTAFNNAFQENLRCFMPAKVQNFITKTIRMFITAIMSGSQYASNFKKANEYVSLEMSDKALKELYKGYKITAVAEGAITGAGGVLLGISDFPALLSIQIEFLFEAAKIYGYNTAFQSERLFLLYIFQLAFSNRNHRIECYSIINNWDKNVIKNQEVDWEKLQIEYRDYMDFAKLLQIVPVVGAPVGAVANAQLMNKLRVTAMNCYRLRRLKEWEKNPIFDITQFDDIENFL